MQAGDIRMPRDERPATRHTGPGKLNPTPRLGAAVKRSTKRLLVTLLLVGPPLVIALVFLAAPKAETWRDHPLPEGDLEPVAVGEVRPGGPDHPAEGTVQVYWNGTGYLLHFEGYDARPGADVWFHVTPHADPDSAAEIEDDGLRVRVPGPGQATYRGDFNVPLPEAFDPEQHVSLVAWDRFWNIRFAVALFDPVEPLPDDDTMGVDGNETAPDPAKGP